MKTILRFVILGGLFMAVVFTQPVWCGDKTSVYGEQVGTFSILGYDPETGMVGGAVQSRVFSVVNGVLWGKADVGMVATQAYVRTDRGASFNETVESS